MSKNTKKYLFYYPSVNVGGAQLLMCRVAEFLINNNERVLVLINSKIGTCFLEKYLDSKGFDYDKFYFSKKNKYKGEKSELLIIPQPVVFKLNKIFDRESENRIFQWDTHPKGIVSRLLYSSFYDVESTKLNKFLKLLESKKHNTLKKYIEVSHKKNSLVFMCGGNFSYNKKIFNLDLEPTFLQLPLYLNSNKEIKRVNQNSSQLNIAWIGRLNSIKYQLVEFIIKDCKNYNKDYSSKKVNFYVIGNGPYLETLYKKYQFEWLDFVGVLSNDKVNDFYRDKNIRIGFNVGTSALEAGLNGLYSVLLPGFEYIDKFKNKDKRYLSLHNTKSYNVSIWENFHTGDIYIKSFNDIMKDIEEKGISRLAQKSHNYVIDNHSPHTVFYKLTSLLDNVELNYQHLCELNIYSYSLRIKIKNIVNKFRKYFNE